MASPSPALSCWERAVCSEPCAQGRHTCMNEFSWQKGGLESSVTGAETELLLQLSLQVCVTVFWGHSQAVGRSLVVTQGMPCRPGKVKGSPLAGFANGMCLCVWEVTFRVSQEPDFAVEALLEGWLLFDLIKENLCIHGFWLDSSVVNPDLSFRNWLIYEHKLYLSSPGMKRITSECIVCRWNLVIIPVMEMMVAIPEREFFSVCCPARSNSPD